MGVRPEPLLGLDAMKTKYVFTCGVYDMFHVGHLRLLRRAKKFGDRLIVGVVRDAAVRRQKGKGRPVIGEKDRLEIIRAIRWVDTAILQRDFDPSRELRALARRGRRMKVFVKGEDQSHIDASYAVKRLGATLVVLTRTRYVSTSKIVRTLRD
jgi:D-beta-D-heptose 7-phosphate kinase/D-beta-D-heptose 1-phosphate adenosyltransferase